MMLERGVAISHDAIRLWCLTSGAEYSRRVGRQWGRSEDILHLDEVFCEINGDLVYLWRAADRDGEVLDVFVQSRQNKQAAKRFFCELLCGPIQAEAMNKKL